MKNAKKVLAMVIVLALAISMAIPASAATVTINKAQADSVFTYWKVASLSYDNTYGPAYRYEVTEQWKDFVDANDGDDGLFNYDSASGIFSVKDGVTDEAVLKAVEAWAVAKNIAGTEVTGTEVTLDDGYYLFTSSLGTAVMIDTINDSNDTEGNLEITEKNVIPSIDKNVLNVTDGETTADKATDAAIDEILEYTITVTKTHGAIGYVVEDTLSDGLEFVDDSAQVSVAYQLAKNGNKLIFTLDNAAVAGVADGAPITITYKVKVTENAIIDGANANSAILKYGKNSEFFTEEVKANAYVWSFDLLKYTSTDEGNKDLPNAEFRLYSDADCKNEVKFVSVGLVGDVAVYRVAKAGEDGVVINSTTGKYDLQGLDSGTYYLKETKAPEGYNLLTTPTTVVIGSTETDATMGSTVNGVKDDVVEVENNTGVELPETGSTGTVIFVTVGSILVLAMGVLLVVRKRMSKVVYTR